MCRVTSPLEVVAVEPAGGLRADPGALDIGGTEVDALVHAGVDHVGDHVRETLVDAFTSGTPGTILTTLKSIWFLPKKSLAVCIMALVTQLNPDEWSGYGGVAMSGSHAASPTVMGLVSLSPSRIAVIRRQKLHQALSSQQLIRLSAPAMFSMAKNRASSTSVSPSASAMTRNVRLNSSTPWTV